MYMTFGRKSFLSYGISFISYQYRCYQKVFVFRRTKKQLESKRMIYTKDQLHLSTTVGQGKCLEDTLSIIE